MLNFGSMAIFWIVVAVLLFIIESSTAQMICIWFAVGALAAALCAVLGFHMAVQVSAFVLLSAFTLGFTRKLVKKTLHVKKVATNADSVIGLSGSVLEEVNNLEETGRVRANGLDWTARALNDEIIPIGATVIVHNIEGVKLMVSSRQHSVPKEKQDNHN